MFTKRMNKKVSLLFVAVVIAIPAVWPSASMGHDYNPIPFGLGLIPGMELLMPLLWEGLELVIKELAEGGDPVHLYGGEYYLSTTDLNVSGRVLGVAIKRRYSSRSEYNSRFGYGWDMNYNLKVRKLHDPNTIVLLNGENRMLSYTIDPNSDPNEPVYMSPAGLYDYIVENQDGTSTLVKKHGTELDFDINGNLSTITDRNGNSISLTYDANGLLPLNGPSDYFVGQSYGLVAREYKLTTITDDLNRQINFTYDANGLLSTITDFAGRTWTYGYDSATNDLLTVTTPATSDYPSGLTTTFTYDPNHNLLTTTDPNGQTYLTHVYDSNDRVSEQTFGYGDYTFGYVPDSNQVTVTDRRGFDTTTVYNDTGNPLSVTIDTNDLRAGDPDSYTTSYEYNSDMDITKKTFPAGNWIEYTYDPNGNLLTVCREPNTTDPNIITTYTYDPNFNFVTTITDPMDNVTTYDYNDINGNLEKITYPIITTPDGNQAPVVSFTYNTYGQVETVTAPDGLVTKLEYYSDANDPNNYGRLWKIIVDANESDPNRLEITTSFTYDAFGNIADINDPNGDVTQLVYDELNQLIQTIAPSPFGYQTNFYYTDTKKLKQIERVRTGDNQITSFTYDILDKLKTITNPLNNITTNSYDNSENLSDVNDAEGNLTHYDYDERNLIWKVTDANNNVTEYSYDDNGNLKQIEDPNGDITTYEYDGFDRLVCITYPDDSNEVFTYDKNSNITGKKNRAGDIIYYEYDALNRLVVKNRPGDPNIIFLYDIAGRPWDVNDGGDVTEYYYDRIGRISDVNDPEDRLVSYEYDDRGLRTKLIYPDDSYITYEYDELSRLTKIIDDSNSILAQYEYDELSRRTQVTLGNDANAVYEYDLGNRLTKLTNNIDDTNSVTFEYSNYDKVGNRLSMKIDDNNAHVYTYDNLYQLTFVDYNDSNSTSYSYDSLGNRTNVNDGTPTTYLRNNLNQYTSVGVTNYSYDNNGNLTDDGLFKYYYDCENRLTDVNDQSDTAVASYSYDYLGRRISKTVYGSPDVTTKYCYDGGQVIVEFDGSDNLLRKFIYGPGIDEPICMIDVTDSNAVYYYHFDGLGSVAALSDANADIVESYSYDVFGAPTIYDENQTEISQSAIGNPYMFTARRADDETALYYYRARYYAFDIGRFLQPDPIGYYDGVNIYVYCVNNPVMLMDPWGLCKKGENYLVDYPTDIDQLVADPTDIDWESVALKRAIDEIAESGTEPLFSTEEDAAMNSGRVLYYVTSSNGVEYAVWICRDPTTGEYYYTPVIEGDKKSVDPGIMPVDAVAVNHSHPNSWIPFKGYESTISPQDILFGMKHTIDGSYLYINVYLTAPNSNVYRYNYGTSSQEYVGTIKPR